MIYIAINTLFNTFLLAIAMTLGNNILHISTLTAWILAYVISSGLTLLGFSRIGSSLVGFFFKGRAMIGREREKLEPLLEDVITKTNAEYGTSYNLSDFKIKISDEKTVNAFAVGYNTFIVNRGAFDAFTPEQLRAILGHEMGHIYYKDSVKSIALIFSSFTTRVIMTLYAAFLAASAVFAKNTRGELQLGALVANWSIFLFFLPVLILNWIANKVFKIINLKMSRAAEYRADAFSASLGYKADMIGALEVLDGFSAGDDNSFMAKMMSTHPATMSRIGALEDGEIAKENMGGLFIATPFAATNSAYVDGNRDIIRLASILGVAGILWIGWGVIGQSSSRQSVSAPQIASVQNSLSAPSASAKQTPAPVQQVAQTAEKPAKNAHTPVIHHQPKPAAVEHVAQADTPKPDNMIHITNVYKVTDSTYTITYNYQGVKNTVIKHQTPQTNTMTRAEFNQLN